MLNAEREREMTMKGKSIITKGKGKSRINKGKLISRLAILCILLLAVNMCVSFAQYPEQYLPTWKYQLKNDLDKGNLDAIEYYNDNYVAKGKFLFGESEEDYLNLATVTGYDATENGILIHTNDGNGYYIEK